MNTLELKDLEIKDDFTIIEDKNFEIVFTNAEKGRSFNRNTEEGIRELNSLKKEFNADDIIYIKQIHSDRILKYESNGKNIIDEEAMQ